MPETRFRIRWPDGRVENCYSPSSVVRDHLQAGARYPLADFAARAGEALSQASERVRAKFGVGCSRAMAQLESIERSAAECKHLANPTVFVESIEL